MKYSEISYEYKKNLGNYEHEVAGAKAVPAETECPKEAFKSLRNLIEYALGKEISKLADTVLEEVKKKAEAPVAKGEKVEEKKAEAPVAKEEKVEEKKAEAPVAKEEKAEEKKEKKPKAKKTKATLYDRTVDLHKKLMGEYLDKCHIGWRKEPTKAKAMSEALQGVEFLDESGIVLESFKEKIKEHLA